MKSTGKQTASGTPRKAAAATTKTAAATTKTAAAPKAAKPAPKPRGSVGKVTVKPAGKLAGKPAGKIDPRARALAIADALHQLYPDAHCELDFRTPFQLLVATILSAQCTDKLVNTVTPALFARFPDARAMAEADVAEVERLVAKTGFFRQKAKNIVAASRALVDKHGGEVPRAMEALIELPGVARKTGNVVLGSGYGMNEGIAVDTHVTRLAQRLGLSPHDEPVKIEQDLLSLLPRERWTLVGHQIIWHGRRVCQARKPNCDGCALAPLCPSFGVV